MKTTDLQCSKQQCCRGMLVRDIEALENERDQLAASVERLRNDYVQACRDGEALAAAVDSLLSDYPDEGQAEAARSQWTDRADPAAYRSAFFAIRLAQEGTE